MIKTLKNLFKQDKERFVVPKGVQDALPIKTVWEDGIFNLCSKRNKVDKAIPTI